MGNQALNDILEFALKKVESLEKNNYSLFAAAQLCMVLSVTTKEDEKLMFEIIEVLMPIASKAMQEATAEWQSRRTPSPST